jgi:hypothetical protein
MATAKNKKNTSDIALPGLGGELEPDTPADSLTRELALIEAFNKYGYNLYVEQYEKGLLVLDTIDGTGRYDLDNITVRYTTK